LQIEALRDYLMSIGRGAPSAPPEVASATVAKTKTAKP